MSEKRTLLTVCTANTCRSPMAAGLLAHALAAQPEPLRSLQVVSAGVAARGGEPVSANSVAALKRVGLNIDRRVSRPLSPALVDDALAIFCMTEGHRSMIRLRFNPPPRHLYLWREFIPAGDPEIADPFGGNLRVYESCRDEMVEAIPSLIAFLQRLQRGEA
jgi:protein-tyrosine-phosphatase